MVDKDHTEPRPDELTADEAIALVLKRPGMYGLVPKAEHRRAAAERDAARAAVERVREVTSEKAEKWYGVDMVPVHHVLAALGGAPEPEWEERLAACDEHGTHCWSCVRYTERRRPAGEWHRLPVEGESK